MSGLLEDSPPRFSDRRRPCRRGEYIVVAIAGPGAVMNTMVVVNAADADEAARFRIGQCGEKWREGRYLVTNGITTSLYESRCGGDVIHRTLSNLWPGEPERYP